MNENFDFIIAGGGMSGLSLAFYLDQSSLRDKKILIIDRESKNANDHTWCFWEESISPFEQIVFRKWSRVWFHGTNNFSKLLSLENYSYKMIQALDFYQFIFARIRQNHNIMFRQAEISSVENDLVKTSQGDFRAKCLIFDSFTREKYDNPKHQNMWQHFLGWVIEAKEKKFNGDEPTLFDFRIEQKDECRFAYILPYSETKALIEFTVFSDNILLQDEYEQNLRKYISEILQIKSYEILHIEAGVIPMSDAPHNFQPQEKCIRIGGAGGYIKSSTGYSFQRTQRRLQKLVKDLESNLTLQVQNNQSIWTSYLDSVLINVLLTKKHRADEVFTALFSRNKTAQVLKFLDEDTNLREDLKIMQSVPLLPFVRAAVETAIKNALRK